MRTFPGETMAQAVELGDLDGLAPPGRYPAAVSRARSLRKERVDNQGAVLTTPAEPGHQLLVQAIAQREGFLTAQRGGPRRNPFRIETSAKEF